MDTPSDNLIPYGAFKEEPILQSDSDNIPGLIDQTPRETENIDVTPRNYDSHNDSDRVGGEAGLSPPSLLDSKNKVFPILDLEAEEERRKRKRRRRRKKQAQATSRVEDNEQIISSKSLETDKDTLTSSPYKGTNKATYSNPSLKLPPIKTSPVVAFVSSSAVVSPVLPEVNKVSRPEPLGEEEEENYMDSNGGATNMAYTGTSFTSVGEVPMEKDEEKEVMKGLSDDEKFVDDEDHSIRGPVETTYFSDGVRRIDFMLAYVEEDDDDKKDIAIREKYEESLLSAGVELEREPKENSQDQKTVFVKVHCPWEVCLKYAERMKMKMPLKDDDKGKFLREKQKEKEESETCSCIKNAYHRLMRPFTLKNVDSIQQFVEDDFYTAEFSRDKMQFFDIKDTTTFFSNAERSRIAHRLMNEASFGEKKTDIGITRLVANGVFSAAYPLHSGKYTSKVKKLAVNANMRRILYWEWARWGRWYKNQPLDLIRYYLGDKIAIYFAWLGFYTNMLLYPTFVGLICTIYSVATLGGYSPTQEVCDASVPTYAGNYTMCPLCDDRCTYWKLKTSCFASMVTYVFDNESTIFFAVFMSMWATMFLEFWKRKQFKLTYEWDLVDYDEERDLIRPEFEAQVELERLNPITGEMEPYMHPTDRFSRTAFSLVTVVFWIAVIIAAVFAVIIYRLAINAIFAASINFSSLGVVGDIATPSMLTTITASLISLLIIMLLNKVYEKVAMWLTNMELPRTMTEFEDSFTFKMFCFQFVNYYSYLFYIAFFKNSFSGYPSEYNYLFGRWRWEACEAGGCMYELSLQLIIIMFGKQLWNNIVELLTPWALNKYRQWKSEKATKDEPENEYTRWEQDYDLSPLLQMDLFYEYLEMVIQFGFVTLFVAAFPLAPVLALLNNIVEIRLDAHKFICEYRRPLARKCSDIGAWYFLLEFLGTLAVVTNSFTIAITSEAIPKLVYYYFYSPGLQGGHTLVGYTEDSLSLFDVSDFTARSTPSELQPFPGEIVTQCRYRAYRTPPTANPKYIHTDQYWHVLAARLAFVIAMEHVVFFLKRFLDYLIPDRPKKLVEQMKREHFLVQKMLFNAEKAELIKKYDDIDGATKPTTSTEPDEEPTVVVHENETRATTTNL